MVKRIMAILILAGLLAMGLSTVPASAANQGSSADGLLIYEVSCTPDGGFSAHGFARRISNQTGSLIVTIDFVGICSDGQVLALTYAHPADLSALLNPNGKPNGHANGYDWSVNDVIVTIPELGPVSWSAIHIKVALTNKWGGTTKETDLPLPSSPF
jgi:hypothetical protein